VAILARFDAASDQAAAAQFPDVPETYWAYREIADAVERGWVRGYEDGTFRPNQSVTRAEAVTILNRVLARGANRENLNQLTIDQFSDNQSDAWYYYEIIEAANGHASVGDRGEETWLIRLQQKS
jgi:hypothetical protein